MVTLKPLRSLVTIQFLEKQGIVIRFTHVEG